MKLLFTFIILLSVTVTTLHAASPTTQLSSFTVIRKGQAIMLSWSTQSDLQNNYMQIECSSDGRNWETIALVFGADNNRTYNQYSYTNKSNNNTPVYYRIRQQEKDGRNQYSPVKVIMPEVSSHLKVTTCGQLLTVVTDNEWPANCVARLLTIQGFMLAQQNCGFSNKRISFVMKEAVSGPYLIQVSDGRNFSETTLHVYQAY